MVISSPKMAPGSELTHNPVYMAMRASADTAKFTIGAITAINEQHVTASRFSYRILKVISSYVN